MSRTPLDQLKDRMLEAPNEVHPDHLPPRFKEARSMLIETLVKMKSKGILNDTMVAVMLSEMLPRTVHQNGPLWAATMLAKPAQSIRDGDSPAGSMQ